MRCIESLKKEEGIWSAFILIFLVSMALMGLGAAYLMRSEGKNIHNQLKAIQCDYAANGAAYFAIEQMVKDSLHETTTYDVNGISVSLDSSLISGTTEILLTVLATMDDISRGVEIQLSPGGGLRDKAVTTTGEVYNVEGKDSTGTTDADLVETEAPYIPEIDEDSLAAMSTDQGYDQYTDPFIPADGYPNGSFYQADGVTPNVTHVMGDFRVMGSRTVYGIFIVEGNVTLDGASRVQGVIYLPNETSMVMHGGGVPTESTVTGGVISHGDITGYGNHISVEHTPEFMYLFCDLFQIGPDNLTIPVVKWKYI